MIFATVGTQLPFDRMIYSVDKWLEKQTVNGCFAQVGVGGIAPKNLPFADSLNPSQFAKRIADCKVIVSHAGMGTILTALSLQKPIIILPRLAEYGEHRNDHQLATAKNVGNKKGVYVARDVAELDALLSKVSQLAASDGVSDAAEPRLLAAISRFIGNEASLEVHHG